MSALVGASGAGKTTVTKLLMRYADPQQGQISIGGVDIRRLTPEQLNSLISVVFQDVWLFDDTCWRISVSRAHRRRGRR
ncbi:putative ABC transporter protein [Klebsiella pneumoniae]|nr:putative ABC transporter protein [Klebsiella pneumoniae]